MKQLAAARPRLRIHWNGRTIEPSKPKDSATVTVEQRQALEWILEDRGPKRPAFLTLYVDGKMVNLMTGDKIPAGRLTTKQISLSALDEDDGRRAVEQLLVLPAAADLRIHHSPGFGDPALTSLAESQVGGELTFLWLNNTSVGRTGLLEIPKFTRLAGLGVGHSPISAAELTVYAALPLSQLSVFECKNFDDEVLAVVAGYPSLTTLELSATAVTDDGLEHLDACRQLKTIRLRRGVVSQAAAQRLATVATRCARGMERRPCKARRRRRPYSRRACREDRGHPHPDPRAT